MSHLTYWTPARKRASERRRLLFKALVKACVAGNSFDAAWQQLSAAHPDLYPQGLPADHRRQLLQLIEAFKG